MILPLLILNLNLNHSEFQLRAVRDPSTGEVIDWKEIIVEEVIPLNGIIGKRLV